MTPAPTSSTTNHPSAAAIATATAAESAISLQRLPFTLDSQGVPGLPAAPSTLPTQPAPPTSSRLPHAGTASPTCSEAPLTPRSTSIRLPTTPPHPRRTANPLRVRLDKLRPTHGKHQLLPRAARNQRQRPRSHVPPIFPGRRFSQRQRASVHTRSRLLQRAAQHQLARTRQRLHRQPHAPPAPPHAPLRLLRHQHSNTSILRKHQHHAWLAHLDRHPRHSSCPGQLAYRFTRTRRGCIHRTSTTQPHLPRRKSR